MEWKKITNFINYSISSDGEVRNDKTGRILKPHLGTSGYYQIMMGRKQVPQYIHRIVAMEFISNTNNLPQVDHINGNKLDNRVENLRWVTVRENCLAYGFEARNENRKKKILAIKSDGTEIKFNSRIECAEYFKCNKSQIEYNKVYVKGSKKGWYFQLVKDIV